MRDKTETKTRIEKDLVCGGTPGTKHPMPKIQSSHGCYGIFINFILKSFPVETQPTKLVATAMKAHRFLKIFIFLSVEMGS